MTSDPHQLGLFGAETPRAARRGRTTPRAANGRQRAREPRATAITEEAERARVAEAIRPVPKSDHSPSDPAPKADAPLPLAPRRRLGSLAAPDGAEPARERQATPATKAAPAGALTPVADPLPVKPPGPVGSYSAQIPDVRDWLHRCYSRGLAHGALLVEALGRPNEHKRTGFADNVATADRILGALEAEGWIVRRAYEPTREQLFFGVGGRKPGKRAAKGCGHAIEHCWEVNEENEALRKFLSLRARNLTPDSSKADAALSSVETMKLPLSGKPRAKRKLEANPRDVDAPFVERRNPKDADLYRERFRVSAGKSIDQTGYRLSEEKSQGVCIGCYCSLPPERLGYSPELAGKGWMRTVYAGKDATIIRCVFCDRTFEGEE